MKHLDDAYVKEFEASVTAVGGMTVVLRETYFYPVGGGQPHDTGILRRASDGKEFKVVMVKKTDGGVAHELDAAGLEPGDAVIGVIDWQRRHRLMRSHTAAHVVSALIHNATGAIITGNQLSEDKVRIDFSLDAFDPQLFTGIIARANDVLRGDAPVTLRTVPRAEAERTPSLSKLALGLPAGIERIRIVEIAGLDAQACGGTHVRSLAEIGTLLFLGAENKGKANRRVSFALS